MNRRILLYIPEKPLVKIKQINHSPDLIAQSLGMEKTFKIAAIILNSDLDPYWSISQTGIDKAIKEWKNIISTSKPFQSM